MCQIAEQFPRNPQALVNLEGPIDVRVVYQTFPSDRCSLLVSPGALCQIQVFRGTLSLLLEDLCSIRPQEALIVGHIQPQSVGHGLNMALPLRGDDHLFQTGYSGLLDEPKERSSMIGRTNESIERPMS